MFGTLAEFELKGTDVRVDLGCPVYPRQAAVDVGEPEVGVNKICTPPGRVVS
jgi:hypothetical protein